MTINGRQITYATELNEILDVEPLIRKVKSLEEQCHKYKKIFDELVSNEISSSGGLGENSFLLNGDPTLKTTGLELLNMISQLPDISFFTRILDVAVSRRRGELAILLGAIDDQINRLDSSQVDERNRLINKKSCVQTAYDECKLSLF